MSATPAPLEREHLLLESIGVVAEAMADAVVVVGGDGRIVLANTQVERLLGWSRDDLIGSTVEQLVPARLRSRHVGHRQRFEHASSFRPMGKDLSLAALTKDGTELSVDISLMPLRGLDATYTVASIHDLRERREAEERLAESETRFRTVFQHSAFGMALLDADGKVLQANGALSEMLDRAEVELVGRTVASFAHPADRAELSRAIEALMRGGADLHQGELRVLRRDGGVVEGTVSLTVVRDGVRTPQALLLQLYDAREARQARRQAAAAEARYRRLVEEIPLVTYVQEPGGAFEYVSPQAEELLGYAVEQWLDSETFYENVVHPSDRAAVLRERGDQLARGAAAESDYRLVTRDGRVVWVHYKSTFEFGTGGRPVSRHGFLLDITERKLAEGALSESEQQLALVFNGVSDLLLLIRVEPGPTYRWLAANDAFRTVTGLTDEELVGKRVEEIYSLEEARLAKQRYDATIEAGEPTTYREELRTADGHVAVVETRLTPVFDVERRCTHLLAAARDITEEALLEAKLREAQKLEAVGRLAGGLAHDFNNLLTVVSFAGEHLLGQVDVHGRREVEHILEAADRAATLTRQLLAFSRRQVLQPVSLRLNTVVSDMEAMLRRLIGEDIVFTTELAPELGTVSADRGQLEQVIVNLVVNARDAMPKGGRLSIGTAAETLSAAGAQERGLSEGRYARLWVSDTGVGMDGATRSGIFEPFFTTKGDSGGSGLGLATVYGIVRQSGGAVEVESAPGEGATFSVYLPLVDRPPEPQENGGTATEDARGGSAAESERGSGTVLLVEDEQLVRSLAERVLTAAGYDVIVAGSGAEGLELAAKHAGAIDLVVTDVIMPGMSGREFVERLQELRRPESSTRVLYVSGYTADVIAQRGILADGISFLEKPFTGDSLAAKVRAVLEADTA